MDNDHWHTLEGLRSCPDKCMPEELIANLERNAEAERRRPRLVYHWRGWCGQGCKALYEKGGVVGGPGGVKWNEHVRREHASWVTPDHP